MKTSGRRMGIPRRDEERRLEHAILRPGEKLPPRGTRLRTNTPASSRGLYRLAELLAPLLVLACISVIGIILAGGDQKRHGG
jgi:hypothetical protein